VLEDGLRSTIRLIGYIFDRLLISVRELARLQRTLSKAVVCLDLCTLHGLVMNGGRSILLVGILLLLLFRHLRLILKLLGSHHVIVSDD
jgi:hypothetical protein